MEQTAIPLSGNLWGSTGTAYNDSSLISLFILGKNLACMLICTICAHWPLVNVMKEACQPLSPAQHHGCVCGVETFCMKSKAKDVSGVIG